MVAIFPRGFPIISFICASLCMMIVDRREEYSDQNRQPIIVLARPKDRNGESYSEIPERNSPETFCWSTKKCLYPVDPDNSQQQGPELKFVVSWHAEAGDLVRIYWQFTHWTTRMFPMDTVYLWPQWFDPPNLNWREGLKTHLPTLRKFRQVESWTMCYSLSLCDH